MKVKLEDIIEAMEFAGMETEYYYDTQSEKVLMLFDGMVDGEDNPELFEDIKEGFVEDYIPLPGQYNINEYRIMEEFIYELPARKNQDVLARAIQGRVYIPTRQSTLHGVLVHSFRRYSARFPVISA